MTEQKLSEFENAAKKIISAFTTKLILPAPEGKGFSEKQALDFLINQTKNALTAFEPVLKSSKELIEYFEIKDDKCILNFENNTGFVSLNSIPNLAKINSNILTILNYGLAKTSFDAQKTRNLANDKELSNAGKEVSSMINDLVTSYLNED